MKKFTARLYVYTDYDFYVDINDSFYSEFEVIFSGNRSKIKDKVKNFINNIKFNTINDYTNEFLNNLNSIIKLLNSNEKNIEFHVTGNREVEFNLNTNVFLM